MNKKEYILPSVVTGILFLIILAMNGLWPFGVETIDYYDMAQWSDLFYYQSYDELHGLKSFVFDWYLNLGRPIPGLSEISLFDTLFFVVPRDHLLECMSILMMIKLMAAAFTMNLFIKHINKELPFTIRLMLSAGYGLCGYAIVNYTIPQWIDMLVLVPLVLMFAEKSLQTGKITGLSVTVFLAMIDFYYTAIQMLMFVFFTGGAYLISLHLTPEGRDKRKKLYVSRLLAGILLGLGLSSFAWIGDLAFDISSARFENGMEDAGVLGGYLAILKNIQPAYLSRWFVLLGLAVPAALTVTGLFILLKKKKISTALFCALCMFMATSQLFLESIHLILHFGSYVNYPVRNGFMIYCITAAFAAALYDGERAGEKKAPGWRVMIPGAILTAAITVVFTVWYRTHAGMSDHTVLLVTMGIMSVMALIHIILIKTGTEERAGIFLWAAELLIFGSIMIGKPLYDSPYGNDPEQEGEYIRISDQLVEAFGQDLPTGSKAATLRIKNPDTSLNANYGEVMRRETLTGWTNLETAEQINGAASLGYSIQLTRMLDSGGNIFSDTILHMTDVISHTDLDDELYEKMGTADIVIDHMTGEKEEYSLYKNRFEMPFAIPVADASKLDNTKDTVELLNAYTAAFGEETKIAAYTGTEPQIQTENDMKEFFYDISVDGRKTLYYTGKCIDTDYYNTRIYVNGNVVKIPSIKENDNELFPAHFNNNTVELGSFEDEEVSVRIEMDISDPETEYEHNIYEIDRDVLAGLCKSFPSDIAVSQGRRSLDIETGPLGADYEGLLIPVPYSDGWTATVNGQKTDIRSINGLFMFIPTGDMQNSIHLSYYPPLMNIGFAITVIAFAAIVLAGISDKRKDPVLNTGDRILGNLYMTAFVLVFIAVFVIPVVAALIGIVQGAGH